MLYLSYMDNYQQIADSETINQSIEALATHIISDSTEQKPVFVALLRGAAPFASKLMFEITRQAPKFHPEIDYMMVSTYGDGRTGGTPQVITDLAPTTDIAGRQVIILDDVLDKGITADFVIRHLAGKAAGNVKLAVLVDKQTERIKPISADYACLNVADVWLAGMGMDDSATAPEAYRWSEAVYQMN